MSDAVVSSVPDEHAGFVHPLRAESPRPVEPAVRRALTEAAGRLLANEERARAGDDPEAIHQARVGVRRLRAHLATFRPLLKDGSLTSLRTDLRWIGGVLGRVRDADVLLARLRAGVDELPPADRKAGRRLLADLTDARDEAHRKLARVMRRRRFAVVRDATVEYASAPRLEDPSAPAPEAFAPLMDRRWRSLELAGARIGPDAADEELHEVRILAKHARYAAEAMAPVFGDDARRFGKIAAGVQDVLGAHQDAVVAQAWLRRAAKKTSPRAAFVAGELFVAERRTRVEARAAWPRVWKTLSEQGPRFWT
jgi:CHAD domain-containing protein